MPTDEKQPKNSILCIEDDEDTCTLMKFVFEQEDFAVTTCSAEDCLQIVEQEIFSAIILDNYFGDLNGVDICREIRKRHSTTPIIFFSGEVRQNEREKALAAGASAYLIKPDDFETLVETTLDLINKSQTSK